MKYLLDTHALLWYMAGSSRLSENALQAIGYSECYYSVASLWEIAIKSNNGKLELAMSIQEFSDECEMQGIHLLQILPSHLDALIQLPHIHRDPFDRILIVQSMIEECALITKDGIIPKYNIHTVW